MEYCDDRRNLDYFRPLESQPFTHPIVQISLSEGEEFVFDFALIFASKITLIYGSEGKEYHSFQEKTSTHLDPKLLAVSFAFLRKER